MLGDRSWDAPAKKLSRLGICGGMLHGQSKRRATGPMPRAPSFIDGDRIRKARTLRSIEPIYERLAVGLSAIPELRYIKLFPQRLSASSTLSTDGKNNPVVKVGAEGVVAVELLIDADTKLVQFYALTSTKRGCGRKTVAAVINAVPESWVVTVAFDWSGGFWQRMAQDYPRLQVC
ncbi:hypothetical protein [Thiocystis violacea]|uniref:hypothetical protein n=1 Tax=Thiocystis violacea TaxID=13725 RepID=UPI001908AB36|nr:hypothetical protein [Thiocystis violacea]MBK1717218.1 hypothetical protein [Thiocystis violacea]